MKSISSKLVLVSLLLAVVATPASAREYMGKKTNAKSAAIRSKAAACKRAQSTAELNINNVRALINGYGNMWYDGSVAQYHLPKGGAASPLYCAALWIGGTDVNDQLRIAALRFGQNGDDFWPGPLKVNGTATIDLPVCNAYDKHWIITKAEVSALMEHFDYDYDNRKVSPKPGDPGPSDDITDVIQNWPAHGQGDDLTNYLAPFYDADDDLIYDPYKGDYPYYDFDNQLCPRFIKKQHPELAKVKLPSMEETRDKTVSGSILSDQVLKGDQTIWWVFNDMGNTHTETNGQPIGLEIRAQAFAFSTNDDINNMTFYSYEIINRSTYELRETYFSQWVDPDLGTSTDDFVGCDVRRGLGYCYNATSSDAPGSTNYAGIPPAVGIDFFQGPYMDADGKDNPKIDIQKIQTNGNEPTKNLLKAYELYQDGVFTGYDTIQISYDADKFPTEYWYFKPGDEFGNCAINGVNFGNGIVDDERFGMRRFVYYNNDNNNRNGEPSKASDYYYYLRGYWKNGQRMKFGGNALPGGNDVTSLDCDFMFPGDSDPWNWGTDGVDPGIYGSEGWTEITAGNNGRDVRFMQSAGPFTLKPGALNYITVGIPFAQATSGDQWTSVTELRRIDDVCQALFENCFKVIDGPDAPTMTCQELSNEVILYLSYESNKSNNYGESYDEVDPSIPTYYTDADGVTIHNYPESALHYKFEGYQIFQLKDASCSVADIYDPTKAKLVAQCDIENYYDSIDADGNVNANPTLPIGTLVNYSMNSSTNILTGNVMVQGANKGIQHAFRITNDAFASGNNTTLVNNKEYYFVAIAYAHNRFREYSQTNAAYLEGQKTPYLAGRKGENGEIKPIKVIPHSPAAESGGKVAQAVFGMSPNVIRLGGYGNGGFVLRLAQSSIDTLMGITDKDGNVILPAKEPGVFSGSLSSTGIGNHTLTNPCIIANPAYVENYGPINVRVIDPLKIKEGRFNILFWNEDGSTESVSNATRWSITRVDGKHFDSVEVNGVVRYIDTIPSDFAIGRYNEQLFLDLGIAVSLSNPVSVATEFSYPGAGLFRLKGGVTNSGALLGSDMFFEYEDKQWLSGIPDNDSYLMQNWIRSGAQYSGGSVTTFTGSSSPYNVNEPHLDEDYYKTERTGSGMSVRLSELAVDKDQIFEKVVSGLWAPYALTSSLPFHPAFNLSYYVADQSVFDSLANANVQLSMTRNKIIRKCMSNVYNRSLNYNDLSRLPSVRIVFTPDQTKWTRCPVIEMCDDYLQAEGEARRFSARRHASVNKDGKTCEDLGVAPDPNDPNNPAYISENGMGWFPGYAINTITGERLNIMFGEDSRYAQHNGRDMMWNPVSATLEGTQNYVMGGRHYIYVMNATMQPFYHMVDRGSQSIAYYRTPSYDAGRWAMQMLGSVERLMRASVNISFPILRNGIVGDIDNFVPVLDSISLLYASVAWVNMPLVSSRYQFQNPKDMPCDATIDIDVRAPYNPYLATNHTTSTDAGAVVANKEMPAYQFYLSSSDAVIENLATASNARQEYIDSLLGAINVVPNPYYSYSEYETASQLETKVRIVNLPTGIEDGKPQGCTIRIYTVDGTLVRTLGPTAVTRSLVGDHEVENTTVDWDLHNQTGIPIAGGMYLIHVSVPGIGERVIKWFGTMRPVDLNSFQF